MGDMAEKGHSDDGIDESDEGKQSTDVEQGWQGDYQSEQKLPDSLGSLDNFKSGPFNLLTSTLTATISKETKTSC